MLPTKLFFYDLETTGTKFWRNGIHQISGKIVIDGRTVETFNFHVRPNPSAEIEDEALQVANVTREQIMAYPPMEEVFPKMIAILDKYVFKYNKKDKFYLVGFNIAHFDNQFFRAWFVQNHHEYFGSYFWANCLDMYVMATPLLMGIRATMDNFKQATVAKALGIPVDDTKLHDALYDIEICHQIYNKVIECYQQPSVNNVALAQ